jgi:hypothetical protein
VNTFLGGVGSKIDLPKGLEQLGVQTTRNQAADTGTQGLHAAKDNDNEQH